jgi:uncharacterized membrane protein (DUF485 family)
MNAEAEKSTSTSWVCRAGSAACAGLTWAAVSLLCFVVSVVASLVVAAFCALVVALPVIGAIAMAVCLVALAVALSPLLLVVYVKRKVFGPGKFDEALRVRLLKLKWKRS